MFSFNKKLNFNGFTLLIPSISVGNVAQLTTDLIIQNLKAEKVAEVWHPCIVPLIAAQGSFDFDRDTTTASELFVSEQHKLLILQIRTPLTASLIEDFLQQIVDFSKTNKIAKLVLLTSCYSMIGMNLMEYIQNDKFKKENAFPLEQDWKLREDDNIFGKGFSLRLFKKVTENDISCVNFLIYVHEGDNTVDSEIFLKRINNFLKILAVSDDGKLLKLDFPSSWKYLFGNDSTVDVY